MSTPVPIDMIPQEGRGGITPDSPGFKAYAASMENAYKLPPGTLTGATYELKPGTDPVELLKQVAENYRVDPKGPSGTPVPTHLLPPSASAGAPDNGTTMPPGVGPKPPIPYDPSKGDYSDVGPLHVNLDADTGNFMAGMGRSVRNTVQGLGQSLGGVADAVTAPVHVMANVFAGRPTPKLSSYAPTQAEVDDQRRLDGPLMNTKAGLAGDITGSVVQTALPSAGLNALGKVAAAAKATKTAVPLLARGVPTSTIGQNALLGGAYSGVQPVATGENRATNAAEGVIGGGVGGAVGSLVGAVARPAVDGATGLVKTLAKKAMDTYGIPLRAAQISENPILQGIVKAVNYSMPFNGLKASVEGQNKAFNDNMNKLVGQDGSLTPTAALSKARSTLGDAYTDLYARNGLQVEPWHVDAMNDINSGYAPRDLSTGKANTNQLGALRKSIVNATDDQGMISGPDYKMLRSQIGTLANNESDPYFKTALSSYKTLLDKSFKAGLSPEDVALQDATDKHWNAMRTLEGIAPTGPDADWQFSKLGQVMASRAQKNSSNRYALLNNQGLAGTADNPSMADLAHIGQRFLGRGDMTTASPWAGVSNVGSAAVKTLGAPAIGGGLYALASHAEDKHPIAEAAGATALLMAGGYGLGRGLNSRWFARGLPALNRGNDEAFKYGLGQLPSAAIRGAKDTIPPEDPLASLQQ